MNADIINMAINMGWRLDESCVLVPPGGLPDTSVSMLEIRVPESIVSWLEARQEFTPGYVDSDRILNYIRLNYPKYLEACNDDESWAMSVLVLDASIDLKITEEEVWDVVHRE